MAGKCEISRRRRAYWRETTRALRRWGCMSGRGARWAADSMGALRLPSLSSSPRAVSRPHRRRGVRSASSSPLPSGPASRHGGLAHACPEATQTMPCRLLPSATRLSNAARPCESATSARTSCAVVASGALRCVDLPHPSRGPHAPAVSSTGTTVGPAGPAPHHDDRRPRAG